MAAALIWTAAAAAHLADIAEYIDRDSPRGAARIVRQLVAATQRLSQFPFQGRVVPEFQQSDLREVICGKYRVVYRVGRQRVLIIAVVHGARRLDEVFGDPDVAD